jgi:hypothetical protein
MLTSSLALIGTENFFTVHAEWEVRIKNYIQIALKTSINEFISSFSNHPTKVACCYSLKYFEELYAIKKARNDSKSTHRSATSKNGQDNTMRMR